jgi:hypothetical protein
MIGLFLDFYFIFLYNLLAASNIDIAITASKPGTSIFVFDIFPVTLGAGTKGSNGSDT